MPKKKATSEAPAVYQFTPNDQSHAIDRSIVFELGQGGSTVRPAPLGNNPTEILGTPVTQTSADARSWVVQQVLSAEHLISLSAKLRNNTSLLEPLTEQLFQHLLKVYRYKVEEILQQEGIASINTARPHFKLIKTKQGEQKLDLIIDDDRVKAYLRSSLAGFFSHTGFWEDFAKTIGTSLVLWVLDNLEQAQGKPAIEALSSEQLTLQVRQYLDRSNDAVTEERIQIFGQIYCQDMAQKIISGFKLPQCSLTEMEQLLGLKPKPRSSSNVNLELNPIAVIPTAIPIASSIRAQLRSDLWQQNSDELAVFQYRSRSNPNNYIEHYITNLGDIELLPWTAAEQIIDKFGFDTVKLQLIFAARTMEEVEPWQSTFTLRASDIIQLLGWDRNHSKSLAEKRNSVASLAYALSCLLVKSVWMEGRGKKSIDASTPIGRMWDVLIDPHGQIDWTTGKIEKPEEVYITVNPGLWTKHYLNRAGSKAKEALHQFGYLAKDILKIDPYHHEMALRLAIQLTLDARIRVRNQHPYDYQVMGLLGEVLPQTEIDLAVEDKHKARDLKNRWNKALEMLVTLGWQIEYDPETYPEWLRSGSNAPKPENWRKVKVIERLLHAKLTIKPPHPIPGLLNNLREAKKPKALPSKPTALEELTGEMLQKARTEQGWNRKELGGFLGLSADYIGKLERGDRIITPEIETKLRRLLKIN
jgi:DNA-binding XRE family transcriptional regulator